MSDSALITIGQESVEFKSAALRVADFYSIYDSGLITTPHSGVILHRKGLGSEQIVYQYEPEVKLAVYKESESDTESDTYELGFPYVIALISYEGGIFKGIRHFYSPTQVRSLDQPLYMVNLPNTNTRGYVRTSVGWVCLYVSETFSADSLEKRLSYALDRHSPLNEPYNYGNMSETDGFTSYRERFPKKRWLWDPEAWAEKTAAEGLDWTRDPDLWVPVKTGDKLHMRQHDMGEPYTLRKALYDSHYVYYEIEGAVLLNKWAAGSEEQRARIIEDSVGPTVMGKKAANIDDLIDTVNNFPDKNTTLKLGIFKACCICGSKQLFPSAPWPNVIRSIGNMESLNRAVATDKVRLDYLEAFQGTLINGPYVIGSWACKRCTELHAKKVQGKFYAYATDDQTYISSKLTLRPVLVMTSQLKWDTIPVNRLREGKISLGSTMPQTRIDLINADKCNEQFPSCNHCGRLWDAKIPEKLYKNGYGCPGCATLIWDPIRNEYVARSTMLHIQEEMVKISQLQDHPFGPMAKEQYDRDITCVVMYCYDRSALHMERYGKSRTMNCSRTPPSWLYYNNPSGILCGHCEPEKESAST